MHASEPRCEYPVVSCRQQPSHRHSIHRYCDCCGLVFTGCMPCPAGVKPSLLSFIDNAKLPYCQGALSVSGPIRPLHASFGLIRPLLSVGSHKSMPNCSATYFTATGGSSLSRGLTPSMASSSRWRESHLCKVFTDTPAAAANWAFVIAIMIIGY